MTTNERIALALGWVHGCNPERCGGCIEGIPDYEHSLGALLEPLGVLRERGWAWECGIDGIGQPWGLLRREGQYLPHRADTPSEALALAVAEALEASK